LLKDKSTWKSKVLADPKLKKWPLLKSGWRIRRVEFTGNEETGPLFTAAGLFKRLQGALE
jgi:hypothetical protein